MQYEAQELLVVMISTLQQKAVCSDRKGNQQCKTREVQTRDETRLSGSCPRFPFLQGRTISPHSCSLVQYFHPCEITQYPSNKFYLC